MVAGAAGLATSYFVAMVMTIRESPVVAVAELVIRLTPGPVVERAISILGHQRQAVPGRRAPRRARPAVRLGRPARPPVVVAAGGCCWRPSRCSAGVAVAVQHGARATDLLPVVVGFVTWVLCLSVLTESLRSDERRPSDGPRRPGRRPGRRTRDRRGAASCIGAGLMAVASVGVDVAGQGAGPRPPPGRGVAAAAAAARCQPARSARRGVGRPRRHRAVADAERELLPDPHGADPAGDRAEGLAAAHPRHGRARAGAHLRRPDGAPVHRGAG